MTCRCGHNVELHEHYRSGTECAHQDVCKCNGFRRQTWWWRRRHPELVREAA